jgi:hypothetical protein
MATRHLSQIELAARWNISHRTLERWRWTGEGPKFIKLGGRVIYRLEGLCCTNRVRDSSCESSVVAGRHEQTDTPRLQDQKLAGV